MTDSPDHPAKSDDPKASLRDDLLVHIAAAQFELETAIADLIRDAAPASALAESRSQLGALNALRSRMANASPAALSEMRGEIASVIATSQSTAQQARVAAAAQIDAAELIDRAKEAKAKAEEIMRGMKDFDSQLRFGPNDTEADYRRREAERQAYIDAENAKGTPEGNLNAAGAAVGQMADAKAHGAGGPEFEKRWAELVASTEKLREAAQANGISTEEFDRRLREDLRRILKSKGLSDAQIDAQFAAHPDPLEATKAYVAVDNIDTVKMSTRYSTASARPDSIETAELPEQPIPPLADAMATLRAAGVVSSRQEATTPPAHGVTAQVVSSVGLRLT